MCYLYFLEHTVRFFLNFFNFLIFQLKFVVGTYMEILNADVKIGCKKYVGR